MSKVTIRDVAQSAGVGIGTVSRVLNNSPQVSQKTREIVLATIAELGYRPNAVARQLPRKNTLRTIGVMTRPFLEYHSFSERLRGVQRALHPHQESFEIAVYTTAGKRYYDDRFAFILENSMIEGLLVIDLDLTDEQKDLLRGLGIAFIGINHFSADDWLCIGTNNVDGGYMATNHLLELGHRRIGYVGNHLIDAGGFSVSQDRYIGYQKALREYQITPDTALMRVGASGFEAAKAMAYDLLAQAPRPTAIFAMSDTQALACIAAAKAHGLAVPDDLSVMGYDDLELSHQIGLSTVRQHLELSGEIAMAHLIRMVEGIDAPDPALPPLAVIQRETTQKL